MQAIHLHVTQLASDALLQPPVRLPKGLPYCRPQDLLVSPDSRLVVVRYGDAWAGDTTERPDLVDAEVPAGLVFVDLQAGSCVRENLPYRALISAGLPLQCSMASSGSLVVLHADEDSELCLSVFSASSSHAASITYVHQHATADDSSLQPIYLAWAPSARAIAYTEQPSAEETRLCIWHPFAPTNKHHSLVLDVPMAPGGAGKLAWSPCSIRLLVQFDMCIAVVTSTDFAEIADQAVAEGHMCPAWGLSSLTRLSSLSKEETRLRGTLLVARQLRWSAVQGVSLQPPFFSVDFGDRVTEMQPAAASPDGSHYALVTWQLALDLPENHVMVDPRLEVFSAVTGRCMQLPLTMPPSGRPWSNVLTPDLDVLTIASPTWTSFRLCWAADGSALLCSSHTGQHLGDLCVDEQQQTGQIQTLGSCGPKTVAD